MVHRSVTATRLLMPLEPNVEAITKAIVEGHCQAFGEPVPIALNLMQEFQRVRRMLIRGSRN